MLRHLHRSETLSDRAPFLPKGPGELLQPSWPDRHAVGVQVCVPFLVQLTLTSVASPFDVRKVFDLPSASLIFIGLRPDLLNRKPGRSPEIYSTDFGRSQTSRTSGGTAASRLVFQNLWSKRRRHDRLVKHAVNRPFGFRHRRTLSPFAILVNLAPH